MSKTTETKKKLNVIPLKNMVIIPSVITPIIAGRPVSIKALENAIKDDRHLICVAQKNPESEEVASKDLYKVGTKCKIVHVFKQPDGNIRVLLEGISRVIITRFYKYNQVISAVYETKAQLNHNISEKTTALLRLLKKSFIEYLQLNPSIPDEIRTALDEINDSRELFYFILSNNDLETKVKQYIYEIDNFEESVEKLIEEYLKKNQILKLELQIAGKVKSRLDSLQKEYYLAEQLKIINKELGLSDDEEDDISGFKKLLNQTPLSSEAYKKAEEEIKKLARTSHNSQEYAVIHSYLKWIFDLPWEKQENAEIDIKKASNILDSDHYGLKKVKERILEYMAVLKLSQKVKGQILCLVGPPGVGKTSLGKSIARALEREFVRISLGGVRDEAEIRGHRRTYVGAMPGVIIQSMKKARTTNPLIMMDEIDKMSMDFRGDPASALLEVLDAEQNDKFRDHYLDFGYDLSSVLFITTANNLSTIPQPLLDRMEVIKLPGYTENEKEQIATQHLIPKALKNHDVDKSKLKIDFKNTAVKKIIQNYTREAGVRELERKISKVIRKVIKLYVEDPSKKKFSINSKNITEFLGVADYMYSEVNTIDRVGVVTGLAWTAVGGETLSIEVIKMPGSGKIKLTGRLGDVMLESAQAAISYARLHAKKYGISPDFYKRYDIHLHIPEGAIPKDGPSAGVTMTTAIISVLSNKKVNAKIAMTGEITLTGNVLPIGGLPEKLIAAKRAGIKKVIIPKKNERNLVEISSEIKEGFEIVLVEKIDQVLQHAIKGL